MKSFYLILLIFFVIISKGSAQGQNLPFTSKFSVVTNAFSEVDPNQKCSSTGGTCMNPNNCIGGDVLNGLCPGDDSNKCCIPITDEICKSKGGTCMNPNSCNGGRVEDGLCPGTNLNKCCILDNPNISNTTPIPGIQDNKDFQDINTNNTLLYVIIIILSALIVIIIIMYIAFTISKKWITRSISTSMKNIPTLNNNNNNRVEQPPNYFDVVNDEEADIVIYTSPSTSSSSSIKKNPSNHGQVKIAHNKNSLKNHLFSIIEGTSDNERNRSFSNVGRSQAVMINLDEPLESSSSIKKKKSVSTVEESDISILNLDESHESSSNTNTNRATFSTIERSKAIMLKK